MSLVIRLRRYRTFRLRLEHDSQAGEKQRLSGLLSGKGLDRYRQPPKGLLTDSSLSSLEMSRTGGPRGRDQHWWACRNGGLTCGAKPLVCSGLAALRPADDIGSRDRASHPATSGLPDTTRGDPWGLLIQGSSPDARGAIPPGEPRLVAPLFHWRLRGAEWTG
jgi:hypothetical protein